VSVATIADSHHSGVSPSALHALPALEGSKWFRLGGADLVFILLCVIVVHAAKGRMLDDPGLGWHLRDIDAMVAEGGWLHVDPFSDRGGGQRWYSNQWLGELPLWLGERWAGLEGIAAVSTLLIAFTLRCLYCLLARDGLPWPVALFWTWVATLGTLCSWVARPNLFTMLFVLLTASVLDRFHRGLLSRRRTLWLLPMFALWVNVHGGFLAGFILLGGALLIEAAVALFAPSAEVRTAARERAVHLAWLSGGAFLATLVNPYGWAIYPFNLQILFDPWVAGLNTEWQSPDFHSQGSFFFEGTMLLFPLLVAVSRRRPTAVELGLAVLWLHLALNGFRYVPLWILVVVPLLARCSVGVPWLVEWAGRLRLTQGDGSPFARPANPSPWLWSAIAAVVLLGWARLQERRFAYHRPEHIPTAALDRLLDLHRERPQARVVHGYDWGGYLIWHGWPGFRTWIDDRNLANDKENVDTYYALLRADPGWERVLDDAGVELVCVQPNAPLVSRLAERPSWREVFRDSYAVVLKKIE
jgi:hypothetical protein